MSWLWRLFGCVLLMTTSLAACQQQAREATPPSTERKAGNPAMRPEPVALDRQPPVVDWSMAHDCQGMLLLLKRGLDDGRITDLDGTPFRLIHDDPLRSGRRWSAPVDFDATAANGPSDARCVLRVGAVSDQASDHRILGREQVRSRYQNGTRREKNPAYEVAKVRLRHAEKAAKPGKSSIIKVGDPLIDLVGTLVGGALTGFGQWGAGDQLEEALDTLMETPPSIEHPRYRDYHFERTRIRGSREATMPILLTDRVLQRSWQASLKRREHREMILITGLDRQDEHYLRHRQDSLTEDGLERWLAEAPSLPLADMVTVLLDRPSNAPVDRLALGKPMTPPAAAWSPVDSDPASRADDDFMDAAALPLAGRRFPARDDRSRSSSDDIGPASRIKIIGETMEAEGVYIAPHFILTPSDVIGERGLVDLEESPGRKALGLIAAVDHGLGLALIHAPAPGSPVVVGESQLAAAGARSAWRSNEPAATTAAPVMVDGQLIGFTMGGAPSIESDVIQTFLDRQEHLLPIDR